MTARPDEKRARQLGLIAAIAAICDHADRMARAARMQGAR